ncbi:hypothetical protein [Pseudomonas sp. S1(2024)]|uniref:hypothetical protein n=1 Tax=Pseudomonas sp. S1(2024) TaxID=3390191 RepID=UPI0039780A28
MEVSLLKDQLKTLNDSILSLNELLSAGQACFATKDSGEFKVGQEAIKVIKTAYASLWYEEGVSDGRVTPIWLGAMAVDSDVLAAAAQVNRNKDQFQSIVIAAKKRLRDLHAQSVAGTDKSFRRLMNEIGLGRLSLRMAYRHIPLLEKTPESIRFSFSSSGKSITRITPEQALIELHETGFTGSHIDYQATILRKIHPDTPLAKIQHLAGYYKANLKFENEPFRKTLPTFLPILYPAGEREPDRQLEVPEAWSTIRNRRKDQKLCSIPLIPTLRIHTYLS